MKISEVRRNEVIEILKVEAWLTQIPQSELKHHYKASHWLKDPRISYSQILNCL